MGKDKKEKVNTMWGGRVLCGISRSGNEGGGWEKITREGGRGLGC